MKKRLKHIQLIAWFLFAVIVVPQSMQIHHVLTVHHYKIHCTAKHERHFHLPSEHCPIHDYVFAIAHKTELPLQLSSIDYRVYKPTIANIAGAKSIEHHHYYLRAPPRGRQNMIVL